MNLYEKYRPASFDQVAGQLKAIELLNGLRNRGGLNGKSYWIAAPSGVGKTSIARLIASEVADAWDIDEIDASKLTADYMRTVEAGMRFRPMGRGTCVIVNEVHLLNAFQVGRLLDLTEKCPNYFTWVFTTTKLGEDKLFDMDDASPLLSRCIALPVTSQGVCKPFAARLREVYISEIGTDGVDEIDFERIVKNAKNNMRAAMQSLETVIASQYKVAA